MEGHSCLSSISKKVNGMFCGVWVNISPGQLTARGQSCNLGLNMACIQRANKDVMGVCECASACADARMRKKEREKTSRDGERRTQTEKGDTSGQASLSLSRPDGLRCPVV